MRNYRIISLFAVLLAAFGLASCSDWTETEGLENSVRKPWEQDPALWADYTAALRAYKQSEHFIVYARLYNSPEKSGSEQDYMRCLPDSLDIVSLTNADNFSSFDREDMAVMREKGTKVLYHLDYAGRAEELADAAALEACIDRAIALVRAEGLDGFAFTGIPRVGDAAAQAAAQLLVGKFSDAKGEGQLLVFEGNPLFVAPDDRAKVDYFVLDTERTTHVQDVKFQVINALDYAAVPASRLLLAAAASAPLHDEDRTEHAAIVEMTRRVVEFGPLGGLGLYDIGKDYYHSEMNYLTIRQAVQTLNPSK